jgi:hypothetical protein
MTKQLISEAGGVQTYIDAKPLTNSSHAGWTHLRIYTKSEFSRDPDYEQTKIELFMEPDAFANLKTVINCL